MPRWLRGRAVRGDEFALRGDVDDVRDLAVRPVEGDRGSACGKNDTLGQVSDGFGLAQSRHVQGHTRRDVDTQVAEICVPDRLQHDVIKENRGF